MKNHQSSIGASGLVHDLQASLTEAEAMLANAGARWPAAAIDAMRARLVAARDRFAIASAGPERKVLARVVSARRESR